MIQSLFDFSQVAPPCERIDDFKYHWQQVLQECHRCQGGGTKRLVVSEETHAPRHLKQMLKVVGKDVLKCAKII